MRPLFDFEILRTEPDGATCWLEAAPDLQTAKDRIKQLSSIRPGRYVVFSQREQRVVITIYSTADPCRRGDSKIEGRVWRGTGVECGSAQ